MFLIPLRRLGLILFHWWFRGDKVCPLSILPCVIIIFEKPVNNRFVDDFAKRWAFMIFNMFPCPLVQLGIFGQL